MKQKISITIEKKTVEEIDAIIDHLMIRNRSQAIEHLIHSAMGDNKTAVILAGGDEKEIKIGEGIYRPTAPIAHETVIERSIKKLREHNFKTIFIVAEPPVLTAIFAILKDGSKWGVNIQYIEEHSSRGTANSLRLLRGKVVKHFLVVYGDLIFDNVNIEELWNQHLKNNMIATLMMTTSQNPSEKGTLKVEGNKILAFIQKPKKSDIYLVFSPIFACAPEVLTLPGNSMEQDIFPYLAEKGLLQGHLSSEKEIHIHRLEDAKKVK